MNSIARKQILDVLDYEKNINKRVTKYAKRQARLWDAPESAVPQLHSQIDTDVLDGVKQISSNLKSILERKLSNIASYEPSGKNKKLTGDANKIFSDMVAIEDVLRLYNAMAQLYSNPSNTLETTSAVKLEINRIQVLVDNIYAMFKSEIQRLTKEKSKQYNC